ncbi:glycosyltransferase [Pseudolysinimonas sp.]|uniref:glycosyltransferase n=1 Tax=Pseudolysinimonas sp. TaxID=2680009 RepID=UPI00286B6051|nr:glycosyltransferase [Pseudolysinimonas sp.]
MKISVAMCTHNGGPYLEAQLRSILDGTRVPDEIVLSDDASTDGTIGVARAVLGAAGVPHQILENPTALGVTANFEHAVRATTGDVIVLADQDDLWHATRLAQVETEFAGGDVLLRHSDARLVDATGEDLGVTLFARLRVRADEVAAIDGGRAFATYLRRNLATGAATAFRRELLADALPFPTEWVHDEWLAILAAARDAVRLERATEIDYRLHGANQIGVAEPTLRYRVSRVFGDSGDRAALLARRSEVLAERLVTRGLPAPAQQAAAKARFERQRSRLPRLRIARVPGILGALLGGGYRRFASQRSLDALRDLFRPA